MGVTGTIAASAAVGYLGSQAAAGKQSDASAQSIEAQEQMYHQTRDDLQPYMTAGNNAVSQIQNNMADWNKGFTKDDFLANKDPGYEWNLQQGQQSLQNSAAAKSGLVNAGTMASLSNYSQNQASNEYQNAFNRYQTQIQGNYNRWSGLAGLGENAAAGAGNNATSAGQSIGNTAVGMGNAQASCRLSDRRR